MHPTREELIQQISELNAENLKLRSQLDEAGWLEGALKQRTRLLNERMKEMKAVYGAMRYSRDRHRDAAAATQAIVNLIPDAFLHAAAAAARATIGGKTYATKTFLETRWSLSEPIDAGGKAIGTIEVVYLTKLPNQDEGPFLKEERTFLSVIAQILGALHERPARG